MTPSEAKLIDLILSDGEGLYTEVEELKAIIRKERLTPECINALAGFVQERALSRLHIQREWERLVNIFGHGACVVARGMAEDEWAKRGG